MNSFKEKNDAILVEMSLRGQSDEAIRITFIMERIAALRSQ